MKWKKKANSKIGTTGKLQKTVNRLCNYFFRTINIGWLKDTVIHRAFLNFLGANYKVSVSKKKFGWQFEIGRAHV